MKRLLLALFLTLPCLLAAGAGSEALMLVQSIPLRGVRGGFNHHSADGKRHRVFLCARDNNSVEVIDLDSGRTIKSLPGGRPSAACYAAQPDILCVSRSRTVQLYDGDSFALKATVTMRTSVDEMHYDVRTRELVVGCMTAPDRGIAAIDLVSDKVGPIVRVGAGLQGFAVEDNGPRVFVCTPALDQVTVVDRETRRTMGWKLPEGQSDHPVAFDASSHRLFVGCRRPAQLLVLDTDTGKMVGSAEIGQDTDDLSWDAANRRIYAACGEGLISVVQQEDADHYRTVQTVPTAPGARNCGFIPETGEFFVTVPERPDQHPTLLVYKANPR